MAKIKLIYVGNDHFQTTKKVKDDTPDGSSYWSCYVPRVITREMGIVPEKHKLYELNIEEVSNG